MKRHIKTVQGHKDFKCKSCEKSFTPDSVREHIKNIHKYFNCDPCEKLLTSASNLRNTSHHTQNSY